jgi:hypothetical protein
MSTTWKSEPKSDPKKSGNYNLPDHNLGKSTPNTATNNLSASSRPLTLWSRQQKFAMIACFTILAVLLIVSACSKQSSKSALVAVSSPTTSNPSATTPSVPLSGSAISPIADSGTSASAAASAKKIARKRPANVLYADSNTGVSFLYPRKFALESGDKAQPQLAIVGDVPMNFAQPGGNIVATVEAPADSYPGTDFSSAFFNVNVNRNLSADACSHFAFVDTSNADGEAVDAEKVTIGDSVMEKTSSFAGTVEGYAETRYYHEYKDGVCYEYVLGLGTEGFSTEGNTKHVNDDEVIARLEKILATVKINPVESEPATQPEANGMAGGKE